MRRSNDCSKCSRGDRLPDYDHTPPGTEARLKGQWSLSLPHLHSALFITLQTKLTKAEERENRLTHVLSNNRHSLLYQVIFHSCKEDSLWNCWTHCEEYSVHAFFFCKITLSSRILCMNVLSKCDRDLYKHFNSMQQNSSLSSLPFSSSPVSSWGQCSNWKRFLLVLIRNPSWKLFLSF